MNVVDKSNNIYIYRWGDLPLWGEVLEYFYKKHDYLIYNKINYFHGSLGKYVNKITNTIAKESMQYQKIRLKESDKLHYANFKKKNVGMKFM